MSDSAALLPPPTTSGRAPRGTWALNLYGDEVVLVHPGGSLVGPPAEVAAELDRLTARQGLGELDRRAVRIIRWLLTGDGARRDGDGSRPSGRRVRM
jgi:hypothetical protein